MNSNRLQGFALATALLLMMVLLALLATYFLVTGSERDHARASARSTQGYYAAEGGANARGDALGAIFAATKLPTGTAPPAGAEPCRSGVGGSGDLACQQVSINKRAVMTWVRDVTPYTAAGAPPTVVIPGGENYAGLSALDYQYELYSTAYGPVKDAAGNAQPEAQLVKTIHARLVPLFQFAAFSDTDLEITPGANFTLNGRVHTNGDLFLAGSNGAAVAINGETTAAGNILRGRKAGDAGVVDGSKCSGTIRLNNAAGSAVTLQAPAASGGVCAGSPASNLPDYGGNVRSQVPKLTLPAGYSTAQGGDYWRNAGLRVVLRESQYDTEVVTWKGASGLTYSYTLQQPRVEVWGENGVDLVATARLKAQMRANPGMISVNLPTSGDPTSPASYPPNTVPPGCDPYGGVRAGYPGGEWKGLCDQVTARGKMKDYLEGNDKLMLNIDQGKLMDANPPGASSSLFNRTAAGGLTLYATVKGNSEAGVNNYAVRMQNAGNLSGSSTPASTGFTFVSDQNVYTQGDFNASGKIPASIVGDTINTLSAAWQDRNSYQQASVAGGTPRVATPTTVNAALLSNLHPTNSSRGNSNGLQWMMRLHENWSGQTLTYRGALGVTGVPKHATGAYQPYSAAQSFGVPVRNWDYDSMFEDPSKLPPNTPRALVVSQELFDRRYDR